MSTVAIKTEIAQYLRAELLDDGKGQGYHQPPAAIDLPCVIVKPADGDGGYISRSEDAASWCETALHLTVWICISTGGDQVAEGDWFDDTADKLYDILDRSTLTAGGKVRLEEVGAPDDSEIGSAKFRYLPANLTIIRSKPTS